MPLSVHDAPEVPVAVELSDVELSTVELDAVIDDAVDSVALLSAEEPVWEPLLRLDDAALLDALREEALDDALDDPV